MLFEQSTTIYFLLAAVILWLLVLSFNLTRTLSHYKKLTQGAKSINLEKVLENLIEKQNLSQKQIGQIHAALTQTQKQDLSHFQKSALVRFNPFEDAGGDQSFAFALLDAADTGIVISSLHSRSGTRVYAKSVVNAKSQAHAFTKEEKEAVDKAARVGRIKEG